MIINFIIGALIIIGMFFIIAGVIGIFKFKDVFCRLQASTNISTLGAMSILIACSIYGFSNNDISLGMKCIIITIFLLITNPVASHAMTRAAYKKEAKLCDETICDEYGGRK
ncbi:monovalent cation/H(+) antiporter subunit G [Clostridium sardiniense]|uniref:Monovalent cation/H(+) antiporter subunit G n=1 Tax=Clostridium sardiniense TaxID=29369 RepID=A0ABS7KZC6_CLOSR|nr:monovalent cation/H(+) antiporter subunit G [Clostridium sardiniense]MBY0756155.1 monovalent cation/H(+) antiporter subunit G [Clostridium sardiniense]MDQ0458902.1 monovalent cation/proton antiporter MnhG/PhaG subunit [Clostridium sardiniense]